RSAGLLRGLETNRFQQRFVLRELRLAGWKLVRAEDVGEHICGLRRAEPSGIVLRHRRLDPFEQLVERRPSPTLCEGVADERRRFAPIERRAVAARTFVG